jgi:hypothetical protein
MQVTCCIHIEPSCTGAVGVCYLISPCSTTVYVFHCLHTLPPQHLRCRLPLSLQTSIKGSTDHLCYIKSLTSTHTCSVDVYRGTRSFETDLALSELAVTFLQLQCRSLSIIAKDKKEVHR